MATTKKSKQREAIITFLRSRKDHPTADVVYANMRQEIPNISLGTVYRNLSLLADQGEILRLSCDGKTDHFDGFTHPHYHFLCKECGAVSDVELDISEEILAKAASATAGEITEYSLLFKGCCNACKKEHQTA